MNLPAVRQSGDIINFDDAKLALIRKTVCQDLTPLEFDFFIAFSKSRGLDPILRQIHAIKRDGKVTIQVAIDGFRLIAGRTGEYAGCDETEFTYEGDRLKRCRITVYRFVQGVRCAFTATARWEEYYPGEKLGFMWKKMPETMLSKVCEALALRKAFPADLSAIYAPEEMDQAANDVTPSDSASAEPTPAAGPRPIPKNANERFGVSKHQKMLTEFTKLGVVEKDILNKYNIRSIDDLQSKHIAELRWAYENIKQDKFSKASFFGSDIVDVPEDDFTPLFEDDFDQRPMSQRGSK